VWHLVRINCLELDFMLSIRLCVVYMFIYKITWVINEFNFLVQLEWIRNRKEAVRRKKS